jgi:hypothetical protein
LLVVRLEAEFGAAGAVELAVPSIRKTHASPHRAVEGAAVMVVEAVVQGAQVCLHQEQESNDWKCTNGDADQLTEHTVANAMIMKIVINFIFH